MSASQHLPARRRENSVLTDVNSDTVSMSDFGPSPSERAQEIADRDRKLGHFNGVNAKHTEAQAVDVENLDPSHTPSVANDDDDRDDMSCMTETKTVTRIEDLPEDKASAIGTVLEEERPKKVPLMVEVLGGLHEPEPATRAFLNQLHDVDLELSIECQFLPKVDILTNSDPYAELLVRDIGGEWRSLGTTEVIANAHFPRFVKNFTIATRPDADMERIIMVRVMARGPYFMAPVRLGEATCRTWDVVSSPGQCHVMKLERSADPKKESWIILSADVSRARMHCISPRVVELKVRLDKSAKPRSKMHYVVNRSLPKGRWAPIYRSEGHTNPDREFNTTELTYADMFCGEDRKVTRIEFFQRRIGIDAKLSGFVQFSMRDLQRMGEGSIMQWRSGQDATPPGLLLLESKSVTPERIELALAIVNP